MSKLSGDIDAWEKAMREAEPPLVDGKPETVKLHPEPKETRFRPKRAEPETPAAGDAEGEPKPTRRRIRRVRTATDNGVYNSTSNPR